MTEIRQKSFSFKATSFTEDRDSDPNYGTIDAYISVYGNVDSYGDVVVPGAFDKAIAAFRKAGKQLPICWNHDQNEILGGCKPEDMVSDQKGIRIKAVIDLQNERARNIYRFIKQGVIDSCSFAYRPITFTERKGGGFNLEVVDVFEGSFVLIPANDQANIVGAKSATTFSDLQLATRKAKWSKTAAQGRVRELTNSQDAPSSSYRKAFLWYDKENADSFDSYKLPYADVVGDKLVAVFGGIHAAAGRLNQTDIPDADKKKVAAHIGKYYAKMNEMGWDVINPLTNPGKYFDEFQTKSDIEEFLCDPFPLDAKESAAFISKVKEIEDIEVSKKAAAKPAASADRNHKLGFEHMLLDLVKQI